MLRNIFSAFAILVLIIAGTRVATRGLRIAAIDHELSVGYATDRFGEPADPDPTKPDSGEIWREEQVAKDDKRTMLHLAAAAPGLIWLTYELGARSRRGNKPPQKTP